MKRRAFITLVGSAAAWPLAARAQQRERVRRIGVLMSTTADDPEAQARIAAFHQGLQELGWTLGRNARVDVRWAAADAASFHRHAQELLTLTPDVIIASATPSVVALRQATRTVPIVFVGVPDPVGRGAGAYPSLPRDLKRISVQLLRGLVAARAKRAEVARRWACHMTERIDAHRSVYPTICPHASPLMVGR